MFFALATVGNARNVTCGASSSKFVPKSLHNQPGLVLRNIAILLDLALENPLAAYGFATD